MVAQSSLSKGTISIALVNEALSVAYAKGLNTCLLYTSPSPRDCTLSRMPSSA